LPLRRCYSAPSSPRAFARSPRARAGSRNDGGLEMAVVTHQVPHHLEEVCQRLLAIDEVPGRDIAVGHQIERLLDMARCVMEAGFAGNLGIVEQGSVQTYP